MSTATVTETTAIEPIPGCDCNACNAKKAEPAKKMNPQLKEKWLTALRSGEYKQGKNVMHRPEWGPDSTKSVDTYCCLGVLAEIAVADRLVERRGGDGMRCQYKMPSEDYWAGGMPTAGMNTLFGLEENTASRLANMNDAEGKTFAEIADWVEEKL